MKRLWAIAPALLFSGCLMAPAYIARGTVILQPQVTSGTYANKTLVPNYTQSSIEHLILRVYSFDGSEHDLGLEKRIPNAQLNNSIVFSNLKANRTYRIKAFAYATTDETQLISTEDANSYTDVTLTNDDRPTLANLRIKLIDRDFNGQATASGIVVTPGQYQYSGAESTFIPTIVTTLAGNGANTLTNGAGSAASFNDPRGLAVDSQGNIFIADYANDCIRKITPDGVVSTFAGRTSSGFVDGTGTAARFYRPQSVAIDINDNLYIADTYNCAIRKISPAGVVSTLSGNGTAGYVDGSGSEVRFAYPRGVAVNLYGNLYISDTDNHRIRKRGTDGVVTTLGGNGNTSFVDGIGTAATFDFPRGLTVDSAGIVYVADSNNYRIRRIASNGAITTIAGKSAAFADGTGTAAAFKEPTGIALDPLGNLLVADRGNNRIRKVTQSGIVTTLAGTNATGSVDGTGAAALFNGPIGIAIDRFGYIYITDSANHLVRKAH